MKEYIEREALEKEFNSRLNDLVAEYGQYDHYVRGFDEAVDRLEYALSAADVVEVVRCKDCKYYAAMVTDTVSGDMETATWGICRQPWFNSDEYDVYEEGYCSYGVKMDKEE